jgi:hypothetical protein
MSVGSMVLEQFLLWCCVPFKSWHLTSLVIRYKDNTSVIHLKELSQMSLVNSCAYLETNSRCSAEEKRAELTEQLKVLSGEHKLALKRAEQQFQVCYNAIVNKGMGMCYNWA